MHMPTTARAMANVAANASAPPSVEAPNEACGRESPPKAAGLCGVKSAGGARLPATHGAYNARSLWTSLRARKSRASAAAASQERVCANAKTFSAAPMPPPRHPDAFQPPTRCPPTCEACAWRVVRLAPQKPHAGRILVAQRTSSGKQTSRARRRRRTPRRSHAWAKDTHAATLERLSMPETNWRASLAKQRHWASRRGSTPRVPRLCVAKRRTRPARGARGARNRSFSPVRRGPHRRRGS
mmetsp:Transcript_67823/g.189319  ORF Transcript_67823/g.189319 Transcript_67823/m.189319 type:complete len:241 (-) Transcript_67823:425-1147(-)